MYLCQIKSETIFGPRSAIAFRPSVSLSVREEGALEAVAFGAQTLVVLVIFLRTPMKHKAIYVGAVESEESEKLLKGK